MKTATVSTQSWAIIFAELRSKYGTKRGDKLELKEVKGAIRVKSVW